jgi:hypothetical protein
MNTEITTKIQALALAIMINGVMLSAAAYLFDGQLHQSRHTMASTHAATQHSNLVLATFRP